MSFITSLLNGFRRVPTRVYRSFRSMRPRYQIGSLIALVVVVGLIGWRVSASQGTVVDESTTKTRPVTVASIASLSSQNGALPLTGQVSSASEATVRAESSGQLVRVYRKLGDYVAAGSVIAEFENSGERAAVLQAQGSYEAAIAGSDIAGLNRNQSGQSLEDSKTNAVTAIQSAYATLDDAIRTKADVAFSNPRSDFPVFNLTTSDSQLPIKLQNDRPQIEAILVKENTRNISLPGSDDTTISTALDDTITDLQHARSFLDTLTLALNQALPNSVISQTSIDGYKASVSAARGSVNASISSLTGAKTALSAAKTSAAVAARQSNNNETQITTASASVKQALGALRAAQSRLEKTIVRSPISGTIISFPISTGDYLGATSIAAVVSNNNALEVISYVSESDARTISVGTTATLDGSVAGIVTRIAPALDPLTKKIEVRIGITGDQSKLTNGSSIRVELARTASENKITTLTVPITAVKITPSGPVVFSLNTDNTLVMHQIQTGTILGDRIVIVSGVTADLSIVTDARGLKEGQKVELATN